MKQATKKSLGVVALGAALTAAAAGAASAAVPDAVGQTAGKVAGTLPTLDEAAGALPGGTGEVVGTGKNLLSGKSDALPAITETLTHTTQGATTGKLTEPATELLGGLPVDATEKLGLPSDQLLDGVSLSM